jgi:Spy/CpxP family protein refolding chaperone
MKSKWFRFAGASILAAGMCFVYAETPAQQPQAHQKSANRQEWAQRRFDRMATYLNLTDAQKTQAQQYMQEARTSAKALMPELKQNREALQAAIKADNKADIERLSAEKGRLMGKMMAIHSEAFAKVYQTLTPDQKAKADQMKEHFRTTSHQRMQNRNRQSE